MEQQTTKTTAPKVTVTRTLTKEDEMRMDTEKFSLTAAVILAGGTSVTAINNGAITDRESRMYLGSFVSDRAGSQNVTLQNVMTREERAEIYEAVEDFIEGVAALVNAGQTAQEG